MFRQMLFQKITNISYRYVVYILFQLLYIYPFCPGIEFGTSSFWPVSVSVCGKTVTFAITFEHLRDREKMEDLTRPSPLTKASLP